MTIKVNCLSYRQVYQAVLFNVKALCFNQPIGINTKHSHRVFSYHEPNIRSARVKYRAKSPYPLVQMSDRCLNKKS
jgi:hypothetical protein